MLKEAASRIWRKTSGVFYFVSFVLRHDSQTKLEVVFLNVSFLPFAPAGWTKDYTDIDLVIHPYGFKIEGEKMENSIIFFILFLT